MGQPVAKKGDKVVGVDTHIILSAKDQTPIAMPLPFNGTLANDLSATVYCDDQGVGTVGSQAENTPHIPIGGSFQKQPSNKGTVSQGSATVFVDDKAIARANDPVECCNDFVDADTGHIVATGTVFSG